MAIGDTHKALRVVLKSLDSVPSERTNTDAVNHLRHVLGHLDRAEKDYVDCESWADGEINRLAAEAKP